MLAEPGDLRRFSNERQLSNYIGLVPGIYQSDESSKTMGLTPRSRSLLRSYIIEAAWVALRRNPELQVYSRKHAGKNPKTLIVKVAHKLVRAMLSVIKNERLIKSTTEQHSKWLSLRKNKNHQLYSSL
ncbi:MAG: IS110 family transposase [Bacteroidota bacterium]|nr:IS110 family transposase [Bacteroidota bacterium]